MIEQKIKVSSPQGGKAPIKVKKIGPPNIIINYILKGKESTFAQIVQFDCSKLSGGREEKER